MGSAVVIFANRQDLISGLRHEKCLLELGRPLAVSGDRGPIIGPGRVPPHARIDHGLDGENVSRLHYADGLVL